MARCKQCDAEVIHVRDDFTGATFPVDAMPIEARGFVLTDPEEGERNPRAELTTIQVYRPHNMSCEQLEAPLPDD